ncbi:WD repeat domain phosphoinositide-interacting protein 2 [Trichinella papuae]|uniref:WD repeat domain phosphoinositide-interacting protein 2 n=1 Tax=Trichinella papuae TaxID=268474 RepID=A0A0V1MV20_9BILA|nr:WD repeat domain phosphoinositide-interacting protein 2 [Trichinella papuae]
MELTKEKHSVLMSFGCLFQKFRMSVSNEEILTLAFNQDATSLAVGTSNGYRLYTLGQVDELDLLLENTDNSDVCIIERLFSSSLVTSVSLSAPRKLEICHFLKKQEICTQNYANSILAIRLNRLRLIVCLEDSIFVHNIRDMKVLHTIRDTPSNPSGLCDLTPADVSFVAYPGSTNSGEVHLFDAATLQGLSVIPAHNGPLNALKFNAEGTLLASASEKGTVIRVFAIPGGQRLFEFRRGIKRHVACTSNTETIHIFKLEPSPPSQNESESLNTVQDWVSFVSRTAANYLPSQVSDILQQERAFATARLPRAGCKSICAIMTMKTMPRLVVASTDGYMYIYNFNRQEGGECVLQKQHRLLHSSRRLSRGEIPGTSTATLITTTRPRNFSTGEVTSRYHGIVAESTECSTSPTGALDV